MPDKKPISQPPQWTLELVRRLIKPRYLEEIEGDLIEEYQYQQDKYSIRKAKFLFVLELLKLLKPNLIKNINGEYNLNTMGTLSNYFKIALRNIKKHRTYSFIKIGGFSIGIAISLLIIFFVLDEFKVDRHLREQSVFRLVISNSDPERSYKSVSVPPILGPSILADYPSVEKMGRVLVFDGFGDAGGNLFRSQDQKVAVYEERFGYADPSILQMLKFNLTKGDPKTALLEPFTLIMTEEKAQKHFKDENPIGKTVFINENDKEPYTVVGVYESLDNSHLKGIDFFFTLSEKEFWTGEQTSWCCYNYVTFVEFDDMNSAGSFESILKSVFDGYFVAYEEEVDPSYAAMIKEYGSLELQHVSQIYLRSKDIYGFQSVSDLNTVSTFLVIAFFILLLACVNFINLTTANGAQRSKEIGMRKAVGASIGNIRTQLLMEAMVMSFLSTVIGTLIAGVCMPFFNSVADKTLSFPWEEPMFYLAMISFILAIGLISGIYPAFFLSRIKTIFVLGGKFKLTGHAKNNYLRSGLVVFQFAISLLLIAGAFIVYQQMSFILNRDLGYNKNQILMIQGTGTMEESIKSFKKELLSLPEVTTATIGNSLPVKGTHRNGNTFRVVGDGEQELGVSGQFWSADDDYIETLGLELITGRSYRNDLASDSNAVVINEAMAHELGLENPINARITNYREWKVVGVVRNFNYDNIREKIRPMMIVRSTRGDLISVKLATQDIGETLSKIEGIWNQFQPNQTIRTQFLDMKFEQMYEDVKRTRTLFLVFAVFGVIVACLGLFGLSVYTVSLRVKEMTIRKVLGASTFSIFNLLTVDYFKLILLSLLISIPIAIYFASDWLAGFSYRIEYFWDVFIYSGLILIVVSLLVVGQQTLKAARANPSSGLRNE